jgi:hypothetical protein
VCLGQNENLPNAKTEYELCETMCRLLDWLRIKFAEYAIRFELISSHNIPIANRRNFSGCGKTLDRRQMPPGCDMGQKERKA